MAHRRTRPKATSAAVQAEPVRTPSHARPAVIAAAVLLAYFAALIFRADAVPPGLNNDVAEEALRGLYLVNGHHLEVITFSIGHSAETLYLYLLGTAAHLFGPTALAIHAVSWGFALACVWMVRRLAARVDSTIPAYIPLLTAACSIWLFHYARSGLRAISAPFFLCAFALLLDRVERRPRQRWSGLACGAVLGLSVYGYSSARVLPIAFGLFAVFRWLRREGSPSELLRRYIPVVLGAFIVSIPNLIFFFQRPGEFLMRGEYVFKGSTEDRIDNVIATILFPLHYPDRYKIVNGPDHFFDGVSAGLVSAGFNPIHIVFAAAMIYGLWRSRSYLRNPVLQFLAAAWITSVATLGMAGPSLTRLLVVLPAMLVFAALGFAGLARIHAKLRIAAVVLILVGAVDEYWYLSGAAQFSDYYAVAATAIGKEASALAARGQSVLCIVTRDANVVRFLTYNQGARSRVIEFYARPFNPYEVPWDQVKPNVVLVENTARFQELVTRFGGTARLSSDELLFEIGRDGSRGEREPLF